MASRRRLLLLLHLKALRRPTLLVQHMTSGLQLTPPGTRSVSQSILLKGRQSWPANREAWRKDGLSTEASLSGPRAVL